MLQSIDTAIAFVLIMTVASLFVTILVQMASAALSLRGKNLANALALTFQNIAPSVSAQAHQLAARILSDPLLSDSTRTPKDYSERAASDEPPRTRPWHFTDVFGATRLANAVRPEEVYGVLKRLAAPASAAGAAADENARIDPLAEVAKTILDKLVVPSDEAARIQAQLGTF
ncbi:MAG TPA: hypothetical protein VF551_01340, partial [Chthoniobacterales bacterium]